MKKPRHPHLHQRRPAKRRQQSELRRDLVLPQLLRLHTNMRRSPMKSPRPRLDERQQPHAEPRPHNHTSLKKVPMNQKPPLPTFHPLLEEPHHNLTPKKLPTRLLRLQEIPDTKWRRSRITIPALQGTPMEACHHPSIRPTSATIRRTRARSCSL